MWTLWVRLSSVSCRLQLHRLECKSRLSTSEDGNLKKDWGRCNPESHFATLQSRSGWFLICLEAVLTSDHPHLPPHTLLGALHSSWNLEDQDHVLSLFTLQDQSHTYNGRETFLFCFMFWSWKFWMCQDLGCLAFDAEPEVTHKREPNKGFCIVACIFQSHFCC